MAEKKEDGDQTDKARRAVKPFITEKICSVSYINQRGCPNRVSGSKLDNNHGLLSQFSWPACETRENIWDFSMILWSL